MVAACEGRANMGVDKNPRAITEPGKDFGVDATDTGRRWVDGKPIFRKVIDFGALPNTAAKNVAHGLTGVDFVLHSYGGAALAAGSPISRPIPNDGILLAVDAVNVTVTTASDLSLYLVSYVVLEFTKA